MDELEKKLLADYKKRRPLYEEFTSFCREQISYFVKKNGFKKLLDQIRWRTKEISSLEQKLKYVKSSIKKIEEYRDLSGIRLVFFIDDEISKFLNLVLSEKKIGFLEVVNFERGYRNPGFLGQYIILKISKEGLVSNSEFNGLLCELQVTNALQNAWANIYHQTIYKNKDKLSEFAPKELAKLEMRYKDLIEGPIRQVSNNIDYLYDTGKKLLKGYSFFSENELQQFEKCNTIEEIWSFLNKLNEHLKTFGLRLKKNNLFFQSIISLYNRFSYIEKTNAIEHSSWILEDTIKKFISIAGELFYEFPENACDFFEQLVSERKQQVQLVFEQLKKLASFDLNSISQVGYIYHLLLANWIERTSQNNNMKEIRINLLIHLLTLELSGTSWIEVEKISIQIGMPPYSKELKELHAKCLNILFSIYNAECNQETKLLLIKTTLQSIIPKFSPEQLSTDHRLMYENDSHYIMCQFKKIRSHMNLAEKIILESEVKKAQFRFKKDGLDTIFLDKFLSTGFKSKGYLLISSLVGNKFNKGHNSKDLLKKAETLAKSVSPQNWRTWKSRISRIGLLYTILSWRSFDQFEKFLKALASSKPKYAMELLKNYANDLTWFCRVLIPIVFNSPFRSKLESVLFSYLEKDLHQEAIVQGVFQIDKLPSSFLEPILSSLFRTNNLHLLYVVVCSLGKKVNSWDHTLIVNSFFRCVEVLTKHSNFEWIRNILYQEDHPIIKLLSPNECLKLLNMLVDVDHVDECVDCILSIVARSSPEKILKYFLDRKRNKSKNLTLCPTRMTKTTNILNNKSIKKMFGFYEELSSTRDTERTLIFYILPQLMSYSSKSLNQLIEQFINGDKTPFKLIMEILQQYHGNPSIFLSYKKIISSTNLTREYLNDICFQLLFVSDYYGKNGRLSQLQDRKKLINMWSSSDKKLLNFLEFFKKKIDIAIKDEEIRLSRESFVEEASFEDGF